jgi:hypothetical protein
MIRFLSILLLSVVFFSCDIRNNGSKPDVKASDSAVVFKDSTTVQMIDSVYNFGKVTDGEKVEFNFRFRNTGSKPLIVSNATASCGCTVPEKPEEPVKPGETGFIKVVFNSEGRVGAAHKMVTVTSNAHPGFPVLEITGEVIAKGKTTAPEEKK